MRPFYSWPRWALEALRAVLRYLPFGDATLMAVMIELWARDTWELEEDNDVPAYPVAPIRGMQ